MYAGQLDDGKDFVHEHLLDAGSWAQEEIEFMLRLDNVSWVRICMCDAGMKSVVKEVAEGARAKDFQLAYFGEGGC